MNANRNPGRPTDAFTLLEVMFAFVIFFLCVFAILGVITNGLRNARVLQRKTPDASMVASEISLTNALIEQLESGDFGDMYPDCTWTRDTYEASSNKLFQVDMVVQRNTGVVESKMSILLFRPASQPGSLDGGVGAGAGGY